jgi:hypothetical protein
MVDARAEWECLGLRCGFATCTSTNCGVAFSQPSFSNIGPASEREKLYAKAPAVAELDPSVLRKNPHRRLLFMPPTFIGALAAA